MNRVDYEKKRKEEGGEGLVRNHKWYVCGVILNQQPKKWRRRASSGRGDGDILQ